METKPVCTHLYGPYTRAAQPSGRPPAITVRMLTKTIRIMKLIVIFTCALIHVQAAGLSQTVTFHGEDVPLEKVFAAVKKQTGYLFFYDPAMLQNARPVTISAEKLPLETFIGKIFEDQPLTWSIENKTIFITRRPAPAIPVTGTSPVKQDPVKGIVRDSLGVPIAAVTITVRGTNHTVKTDANGRFTIHAEPGQVLILSHINMQTREVPVRNAEDLLITMQNRISELSEVSVSINTGYKMIDKSQITGAASAINQQVYDQRVAVTGNFLESLEGKIPGLVYNSQSGDLSIRGVSTFNAVKKPLIVVDGFPTEIDINTINPNDVVSVSVLRDAAAASVYGVRASNGVIVVETKRGKAGKPVFSLRTTYATQPKPDFSYLKLSDAPEFARLQFNELRYVENIPRFIFDLLAWPVSDVQKTVFDLNENLITEKEAEERVAKIGAYDNLPEYERLFYRSRQAKQIDFDVSGGNDKSSYLLGINYMNELPVERESNNDRFLLNVANTYRVNKRMKFDFRGTYTHASTKNGTIPSYNGFLPYEHLVDENGNALPTLFSSNLQYIGTINETNNDLIKSYGLYDQRYFPYAELRANTNTGKRDAMRFQGRLNTQITKWLNFDLGGAYENENSLESQLRTEEDYDVRLLLNSHALKDPSTGKPLFSDLPQGSFLTRLTTRSWNYTIRGQFNFNYISPNGLHDISGFAGIEQRRQTGSGYKTTIFGYDGQSLVSKPVNLQTISSTSSPAFEEVGYQASPFFMMDYFGEVYSDRRFMSYYSEGTYVFDRRFIVTGSVRLDQSNLFGTSPQYRNKPFWSVGAGWRLNNEDFMQSLSWLNDLKLRASYGFNGNVPTSDNGPFLILMSGINSRLATAQIYNDVLSPENQSIRWETTTNYNLGLDYAVFNNRLSGTVDYYYKNAKDVFGEFSADPTSGFNSYSANTASILNKGLEIGLNAVNIQSRRFNWRTGITASFNSNKVTEVKKTDNTSSFGVVQLATIQQGHPIDVLFSYNYAGLNELGQPLVYTQKGEEVLMDFATQKDVTTNDLIYSGTTTPKYVLGLNNQFSIGKFDLSFLFMFYGGHVMRVEQPSPENVTAGRTLQGSDNYWKQPGDELNTQIPGLPVYRSPGDFTYAARAGYLYADRYVRKADFIRLRDLILTYHLNSPWLRKAGISNTQFRCQAQNLWRYTFSGNDIDPDAIDRRYGTRRLETQPLVSFSIYTNF